MAGQLSNAHGTIVIDGDFSAFDANARKIGSTLQAVDGSVDKLTSSIAQGMQKIGSASSQAAASVNKVGDATKKTTRLTLEQRKELELLRRETKRLAEEQREATSKSIQDKIKERVAVTQEEQRITNVQLSEMRKRQQAMKAMIAQGPTATMAASPSSMMAALPGMTAFGSFHSRFQSAQQRQSMIMGGMTPSQALFTQLNQVAAASNQRYQVQNAINNAAPPVFGGPPPNRPGGGRGGVGSNFFGPGGMGARIAGGLRGGLGMGLGVFGAVQGAREVVEMSELATAYDRQRVAAERLAGSQAQLNSLLEAYQRASGGAVSNAIALENVTRLQATGFAKSAEQVERFVRGTRGSSIALGKPQDYIIQEAQLAISNTSVKRLDQIGLGIEEVANKTEALRDANKGLTREMAFAEAVISLLNDKYGGLTDTAEGQATGLEKLRKAWADLRLEMGQNAQSPVNQASNFLSSIINNSLENQQRRKPFREDFVNSSSFLNGASFNKVWGDLTGRTELQIRAQHALDAGMFRHGPRGDSPGSNYVNPTIPAPPRFDADEMSSISSFYERRSQIEEQFNEERLRETEQYEAQRSTVIRNYAKQMAREEEDFARSRARSTRDYNKQIEDFHENAAKRDAEMLEDYNDAISKMQEDNQEKIADLQEEYNEDRERAEREHRDRLLSAAASLDAAAVLEERKRYRRENEEKDKAFKEQLEDTQENLEEQKQEAKEAYEERLQDAKEADEERLRDMEDSRAQQLADEEEDRAIRLARAAEDHQDQLDELDRQHGLRMKQISDEAQKERDLWEKEFERLLLDMGVYVAGLTEKEAARNKIIEEWFDKMIEKMEDDIKTQERFSRRRPDEVPIEEPTSPFSGDPGYANGGWVGRSGRASVHQGEFVLSRNMLSGRAPVPAAIAGAISHNNSRSVTIAEGAISISSVPGDSMEYLADIVEDRMIALLEAA